MQLAVIQLVEVLCAEGARWSEGGFARGERGEDTGELGEGALRREGGCKGEGKEERVYWRGEGGEGTQEKVEGTE